MPILEDTLQNAAGVTPMWTTPANYEGKGGTDELYKIKDTSASSPLSSVQSSPLPSPVFDLAATNLALDSAPTAKDKMDIAQKALGEISRYEADKLSKATAFANEVTGVTALEKQFQQDMELDKKAKWYDGTMSDITKETYSRLQTAKSQVANVAKQSLAEDGEYLSVKSQGELLIANARTQAAHMMQKESDADVRAALVPDNVYADAVTMFPELRSVPKEKGVPYLAKHPNKEGVEVAQNAQNPEALKTFLLGSDEQSTAVKTFLANKAGDDLELKTKVSADIANYQKYINSPKAALEKLNMTPEEKAAATSYLNTKLMDKVGSKDDITRLARSYADAAMKIEANTNFFNTKTWTVPSQAFLRTDDATKNIMAQIDARGESPTVDNLIRAMGRLQTPMEVSAARAVLRRVGTEEAARVNAVTPWKSTGAVEFDKKLSENVARMILHKGNPQALEDSIKSIWDPLGNVTKFNLGTPPLDIPAIDEKGTTLSGILYGGKK